MITTTEAKRQSTLEAVRRLLGDPTINFGYRWDFEHRGKKFITRSSVLSENHDMDFRSSYRGYDYTLNIRLEKGGVRANVVPHK